MNSGAANKDNFFNFKINHDVAVTGYPTRIWRATKKYSVNNTLSIVAVNAWLQFSLAYIAAVIVTSHDMSFIANILNSKAMPAYALASVILGTILLTSLIIKHAHKQEIKDEILKNGKNTIDIKIRGGESDGINEIAQNALTIEIVPDTSFIYNKKENFSIVLPISGKQGEILENKRQENRNKIVLLTVPYVLSGLTVVGALIKFGFVNIQNWKQWTFIAAVGVITIVGACVTLSKLRNNEVDNACNTVKKFDNEDILLPFRKGSVVSVMENKFESKEENDPMSRALRLFDKHLTDLINRVCYLFDNSFLKPSNINVQKTLDGIRGDIKTLLGSLETSIIKDVGEVKTAAKQAIIECLKDIAKSVDVLCKEVSEDVQDELGKLSVEKIMDLVDTMKGVIEKIDTEEVMKLIPCIRDWLENYEPGWLTRKLIGGKTKSSTNSQEPTHEKGNEFSGMLGGFKKKVGELTEQLEKIKGEQGQPNQCAEEIRKLEREVQRLKKRYEEAQNKHGQSNSHTGEIVTLNTDIQKLEKLLKEVQNKQNQHDSGISSETSSTASTVSCQNEEKVLDEELAKLKKEERIREKKKEIENSKKKLAEQEEMDERQEKINGKPSEFLYYVLESIKLEEKGDKEKDSKVEATLRNFNNKIIIHWKDGSQTICHIKKQGDLPSTEVDFVDQNIQAAFETACVG